MDPTTKTARLLRGILYFGLGLIVAGLFVAAINIDKWRELPWD